MTNSRKAIDKLVEGKRDLEAERRESESRWIALAAFKAKNYQGVPSHIINAVAKGMSIPRQKVKSAFRNYYRATDSVNLRARIAYEMDGGSIFDYVIKEDQAQPGTDIISDATRLLAKFQKVAAGLDPKIIASAAHQLLDIHEEDEDDNSDE